MRWLLFLLLSTQAAFGGLEIMNVKGVPDDLNVKAQGVLVGQRMITLDVDVTVPPRAPGAWHDIHLCHTNTETDDVVRMATAPTAEVVVLGASVPGKTCRLVSTWGTAHATNATKTSELLRAKQVDRHLQFSGGMNFHPDWSLTPPKNTDGKFKYLGVHGAFPSGRTTAVWIWAEGTKDDEHDENGLGIAQCNVLMSNNAVEDTTGDQGFAFGGRAKFLARANNVDWGYPVRVPVPPGSKDGLLLIQISAHSNCLLYGFGYEMRTFFTVVYP